MRWFKQSRLQQVKARMKLQIDLWLGRRYRICHSTVNVVGGDCESVACDREAACEQALQGP